MPGVMKRAGGKLPPTGDYLDKDELVRDQEPMGLKSVVFDPNGSQFGPRWVVSVEPWYEGQDEPHGLVTFTNSPTRQPVFEDLQAQIEENNNDAIGPVVLIRAKSNQGWRYFTFADYQDDGSEQPKDDLDRYVESRPAVAERLKAPRPTAPARKMMTDTERDEAIREAAEAPRRRGRPPGVKNRPKAGNGSTEQTQPTPRTQVKPPDRPIAGQEQVLAVGEATCPNCGDVVRGRVLRDETGKGVIIHPHCRQTGKAEILTVAEQTA